MALKKKKKGGAVGMVLLGEPSEEKRLEQAMPVEEPEPIAAPPEEILWEQAMPEEPEPIVEPPLPQVTEAIPAPPLPGQRPKVSPYRSQLVTLCVGPNRSEYRVPQDLLQNGLWEAYLKRIDQKCLEFPSMTENTGHVLVHYLHTGTYQTLDDSNTGSYLSGKAASEFERAVLVYFAALEYELSGLEQLAKHEIQCFGLFLNIFEALSVIDTSFVDFPDKADWLHDYLCMEAKKTFERNCAMFSDNALLNQVTNIHLNRILLKAVVGVHAAVASELHDVQRNDNEITPQDVIDRSEDVASNESVVEASSGGPENVSSNESTMEEASSEEPVEIRIPEVATSETVSEIADYAEPGIELDYPTSDIPHCTPDVECMPCDEPGIEFNYSTPDIPHCTPDVEYMPCDEPAIEFDYSTPDIPHCTPDVECMPCDEVVSLSDSEPTVDIETTVCPKRAEHLLYGSKWKTCKECLAVLRRVAVELARENRINGEGYERIDRVLTG